MCTTTADAKAPHRTPQGLFRVGPPVRVGETNQMTMTLSPDAGATSTASLGVLLDDALGFTLFECRGERAGFVSADLSIDFVRPAGWRGTVLTAHGRLEALTADGGHASARVLDGSGRLIATGTAWGNFIDGVVQSRAGVAVAHAAAEQSTDCPWSSAPPLELIDAKLDRTASGARLTVPASGSLANSIGVMHGGIQACAYDLVANAVTGHAMHTSSLRINFFRPVPLDGPAVFEAEVLRAGRRVTVVRVTGRDWTGRECGVATVTCRRDAVEAVSRPADRLDPG